MWADALDSACQKWWINTPMRQAMFLAQIAHESASLSKLVENLNYGAQGMADTWPTRFAVDPKAKPRTPNAKALQLHRNPEAIANSVYASRMGNGPEASGDGWKYRGRCPIMLTGRDSYLRYQTETGNQVVTTPDLVTTPAVGADVSGWFWTAVKSCNQFADVGSLDAVSDLINIGSRTQKVGDAIGYHDRSRLFTQAKNALGV
jgi:putative chitinase